MSICLSRRGAVCPATGSRAVLVFFVAVVTVFTLFTAPVFAGGGQEQSTSADEELSVFVSVPPQRYFVERVAGNAVSVSILVPPGSPPATYDPTPRQVTAIGNADVWFRIGVPFENSFLTEIRGNVPGLRIVDTREGIELRELGNHDHDEGHDHDEDEHHDEGHDHDEDEHHDEGHDHDEDKHHDEGHDHDGGTMDPHIWLGPEEVKTQAATIRDVLIDMDPDNEDQYRSGYEALAADIDTLREELAEILKPLEGESFFVYHPSFGYLLDGYGIEQVAIETGGGEPTPQQLQEIILRGRQEEVRVVFVQPEFSQTAAQRVAEALDAEIVEVNPLAPDWLANMRRIAQRISEGVD